MKDGTLKFNGIFKLRSEDSEDFLFDLKNWPLGVLKLNYLDFEL